MFYFEIFYFYKLLFIIMFYVLLDFTLFNITNFKILTSLFLLKKIKLLFLIRHKIINNLIN